MGILARNGLIIVPNFSGEMTASLNLPDKIPIAYEISNKICTGNHIFIYVNAEKAFDQVYYNIIWNDIEYCCSFLLSPKNTSKLT